MAQQKHTPQRELKRLVMETCPFCTIRGGDSERVWVARRDSASAFVNPRQYERGAMLVIPHAHRETILDLTQEELQVIHSLSRELSQACVDALGATGVLIYQRNGVDCGQNVPHYHLHVIPRYRTSNPRVDVFRGPNAAKSSVSERVAVSERITAALRSSD